MIGLLREMPDSAVGLGLAGAVWFGVSWGILAPRAMENDRQVDIVPSCVEALRADEGVAIDQHIKRLTEEARRANAFRRDRINTEYRALADQLSEVEIANMAVKHYNSTPLAQIAPMPDLRMSTGGLKRQMSRLEEELEALTVPTFEIPRAPSAELLKTCGCASVNALAGKQTSYAISLATFRLWAPEEISTLKNSVAETLKTDACGIQSWEHLS